MHTALRSASSVNIFGAGLVGVELAAEIAETFPEKKLTLRSREPQLLPGFPEKAQKYALDWFRSRNVTIILENSIPPSKYVAAAGELVYNCTGLKPVKLEGPFLKEDAVASKSSNGFIHGTPLNFTSFVDPRTHTIRVTPEFHLIGRESIFALGDVMIEDAKKDAPLSTRAPKVAYQAELQAWVVSENLKRQSEQRREWSFPEDVIGGGVTTLPTMVDCSLGKKDGILILNDVVITGRLPAIQKDILEVTKVRWEFRAM
jgi:NADH dehydrogenase FAD-containing subunit